LRRFFTMNTKKTDLLCIGNAIVDVFASADSAFMERFGITVPAQHIDRDTADVILKELGFDPVMALPAALPGANSAVSAMTSGGGAANVAKIAAMLGLNAAFAGCAGQDALAAIFRQGLGGAAALLKTGKGKTGLCLVLGGEKTDTRIAAAPGAALEFSGPDLDEGLIAGAGAVVLDGYILGRVSLARKVLRAAGRRGIPVALDTASVAMAREKAGAILRYSRKYPLLVFMNAAEALAFFNRINPKKSAGGEVRGEREKAEIILRDLCPVLMGITGEKPFPVFVIKLGSLGAVVVSGGNLYREETAAITPLNVIGAGDAFCGAFLSAWIRGKSLSACAALGNRVAGAILKVPGTQITPDKLAPFAEELTVPR
jgi:fructokinase